MKSSMSAVFAACALLLPFALNAARAQDNAGFRTPSGNIACALYEGVLRCDLHANLARLPARPRDCDLDWGDAFTMRAKGRSGRLCHGDTVFMQQPVLAYGKTWKAGGFVCVSESRGLTCRNSQRHGWFLNKIEQKLF